MKQKMYGILALTLLSMLVLSGCATQYDCHSDSECPDGHCSLVKMCGEMDIFCKEIQKCVKDEWQCHLCSSAQEKPNYYELCCDNK